MKFSILLALVASLLVTPAFAAGELRAGVGQSWFDDIVSNDEGDVLAVDVGWNVADWCRVGGDFSAAWLDDDAADVLYQTGMAEVTFIRPDGAWRPYAVLGAGVAHASMGSVDATEWAWEAGGGLEVWFKGKESYRPFTMFLDAVYIDAADLEANVRATVGFGWQWGK